MSEISVSAGVLEPSDGITDRPSLPLNPRSMWDWAAFLPLSAESAISLGEGMTPLLTSRLKLGAQVLWKVEAWNPTGSQKDRAVSVAITHAASLGNKTVIAASTGSVGLSCAAYSAKAGLPCCILAPRGTPHERLKPMAFFGAKVIEVDGTFEQIEEIIRGLDTRDWYQASTVVHVNAIQSAGPKTIAYEIFHQAKHVPDWVVVPIGGGGTIHGIWQGFLELKAIGATDRLPKLLGVQAAGFDAVYRAFHQGTSSVRDTLESETPAFDTVLRNLKHRIPPDGDLALSAIRESNGIIVIVEDAVALEDQALLARSEGIFCEPSSAVVISAIRQGVRLGEIVKPHSIAAVLTGGGFRETGLLPTTSIEQLNPEMLRQALADLSTC